jgi:hypothetical protein
MWHTYLSMLVGMAGLLRFQAPDLDLLRAEDGIRTRDPHLGKVFEFVHGVWARPLNWPPVHETSTKSV